MGIFTRNSSSRYPQNNGEVEQTVQTLKQLLAQKDVSLAHLTYRATPMPSLEASPAELAFGRNVHTRLPSLQKPFIPQLPSPLRFVTKTRRQSNCRRNSTTDAMVFSSCQTSIQVIQS